MLTITQIAERLQVSPVAAYGWARQGLLPGVVRVGGTVRVDASAFEDFLRAGGCQTRKSRRPTATAVEEAR
jgi:excisionase family DNA binding protein